MNISSFYRFLEWILTPFIFIFVESGLFRILIRKLTNKPVIIINSQGGQLGNKQFLFSRLIAFAIKHDYEIINSDFYPYAYLFESPKQDFFCRYKERSSFIKGNLFLRKQFSNMMTLIARYIEQKEHPDIKTIRSKPRNQIQYLDQLSFMHCIQGKDIIFFMGWYFFYKKDMIKHKKEIREYFTYLPGCQNTVTSLIKKCRKEYDILIGVHIRQYDMKKDDFNHPSYVYDDGNKTVRVMKNVSNLFKEKKIVFILCSNKPLNTLLFIEFNILKSTGFIDEDQLILSKCDYLIATRSTYSSWSSFYGEVPCYLFSDTENDISLNDFKVVDLT